MSKKMFERIARLLPSVMEDLDAHERQELDAEFERVTLKDCDEAARTMSDEDFRRAIEEALRNLRRRKGRRREEILAVA